MANLKLKTCSSVEIGAYAVAMYLVFGRGDSKLAGLSLAYAGLLHEDYTYLN